MFSFVEPDAARDEHMRLLAIEEEFLQALEIPYRAVNIAVHDLGNSAAKKYDCEAWLPGQQRYREVTSTSNTTDFQARRLDIRYRPRGGGGPRHVATLNGTAVTWRPPIALLENGQEPDGGVRGPHGLVPQGATLTGTAVTWRHLIALLENGQEPDGGVRVPEVLVPWGAPPRLRVSERA